MTRQRFVGDTKTCFFNLLERRSDFAMISLIAEFCDVNTDIIQRWQARKYFPGGEQLIRLRCFLHFAGYEVTELQQLRGEARTLALMIGTGILKPEKINLGYGSKNSTHSLWRVLVQGGGYTSKVAGSMSGLYTPTRKKKLENCSQEWQARIAALIDEPVVTEAADLSADTEVLAASFGRLIGSVVSLGHLLLEHEGTEAALRATRAGADLRELRELLERFTSDS